MKIAVYGSAAGDITEDVKKRARRIGKQIALRNHTLITGACPGIPYEAVIGANKHKGKVIGFSPAVNLEDHEKKFGFSTKGFSSLIYIPADFPYLTNQGACKKYRNIASVTQSDAVVIISGRCGTLNEFTIAYDLGKNIGVLDRTGGITKFIEELVKDWNKPSASQIIYEPNPRMLIETLENLAKA